MNSEALIAWPLPNLAERVAVGRSAEHLGHGHDAAGAGTVLDHELLLELLAELVGQQPHGQVADAARPIGHEHAHRLGRIVGGLSRQCQSEPN